MQRGRSIEAKGVDNVMTGNREVKLEMSSYLQYFQMKIFRFKLQIYRSSRPEVFCKNGVLRNFGKFTGKHLY